MSETQPLSQKIDIKIAAPQSKISPDMQQRIKLLPPEIQRRAIVVQPGTTFYRFDSHPREVIDKQGFDLTKKRYMMLHLSDMPSDLVNLSITTAHELLLLQYRHDNSHEIDSVFLKKLEHTYGSLMDVESSFNIDGAIYAGETGLIPEGAEEIVLYERGLPAIGKIEPYQLINTIHTEVIPTDPIRQAAPTRHLSVDTVNLIDQQNRAEINSKKPEQIQGSEIRGRVLKGLQKLLSGSLSENEQLIIAQDLAVDSDTEIALWSQVSAAIANGHLSSNDYQRVLRAEAPYYISHLGNQHDQEVKRGITAIQTHMDNTADSDRYPVN